MTTSDSVRPPCNFAISWCDEHRGLIQKDPNGEGFYAYCTAVDDLRATSDSVRPLTAAEATAWRDAHHLKAGTFDLGAGRHGVCAECFQPWPCPTARVLATLDEARAGSLDVAIAAVEALRLPPLREAKDAYWGWDMAIERVLAALREAQP